MDEAKTSATAYTKDVFAGNAGIWIDRSETWCIRTEDYGKMVSGLGLYQRISHRGMQQDSAVCPYPKFSVCRQNFSSWKEKNVRTMSDVKAPGYKAQGKGGKGTKTILRQLPGHWKRDRGHKGSLPQGQVRKPQNQFHNFQQRDVDYDALILEQLQKR